MLRDAVTAELERIEAVEHTLANPQQYEIELEDEDGNGYTGRITGKEIADEPRSETIVYLTDDERVIIYEAQNLKYWVITNPTAEDLSQYQLGPAAYAQACRALGLRAVVDL
jgi:hypothetical protein